MVEDEKKTVDLVAQAQLAADRLEKANKENEEIVKRMELIRSREILGGQTSAGDTAPQQKEETPKEYAARMLRGGV